MARIIGALVAQTLLQHQILETAASGILQSSLTMLSPLCRLSALQTIPLRQMGQGSSPIM